MEKKFKYVILGMLIVISICKVDYCKYSYIFEETAMKLTRDINPPKCTVTYSTQEWTNENVIVTIESDKEVEQTSGFELSEDKKKLTKISYVNENDNVLVRDLSGNFTEVEYNVNNIDKEPPQIIGCDNNKEYISSVKLDYLDNVEIQNIDIDKYNDELEIYYHNEYADSFFYKNIDRTSKTITVHIKEHPLNTKKYRYYLNDKLFTVSSATDYTYTGLDKGTEYKVTVEALDINGNILDFKDIIAKTSYFEVITSTKTNENFFANIINIDSSIKKVRYSINNYYNESDINWYQANIENNKFSVECKKINNNLYPSYVINAYLFDNSDNILDVIQFAIDFNTNYEKNNEEINVYEINTPGNYHIKVSDIAGNETIYFIKIKWLQV